MKIFLRLTTLGLGLQGEDGDKRGKGPGVPYVLAMRPLNNTCLFKMGSPNLPQ